MTYQLITMHESTYNEIKERVTTKHHKRNNRQANQTFLK